MKTLIRAGAIVILAVFLIVLVWLPAGSVPDQTLDFERLKDFDFRSAAGSAWSKGERERALALNDCATDNNLPDAAAARLQQKEWLALMRRDDSAMGRLKLSGREAVRGGADSWQRLSGRSVADFFMFAEGQDRGTELGSEGGADDLAVALHSAGLLTDFWPPAPGAASLLKAARKDGALTEPLEAVIVRAARSARPDARASLRPLWNTLMPVWELARNCRAWSQFKAAFRHCASLEQVRVLTIFVSASPDNARKLEQILSALTGSPELGEEVIAYIHDRTGEGLNNLYNGLRKGPDGLRFVMAHPEFVARSLSDVRETKVPFYASLVLKYGNAVNVLHFLLMIGVVAGLICLARPERFLLDVGVRLPASAISLAAVVLVFSAVVCLLLLMAVPSAGPYPPVGGQGGTPPQRQGDSVWSLACFLIVLVVQLWTLSIAKRRLDEVKNESQPVAVKLSHLDNLETYFELPLYLGLAGSVGGFMLLTFYPMGGRILAYSSTVVGIFVCLFLRVRLLMPYRKGLIEAQAEELINPPAGGQADESGEEQASEGSEQ